jgi:hypothetical protein
MNKLLKLYQTIFMDKRDVEYVETLRKSPAQFSVSNSGTITVENLNQSKKVLDSYDIAKRLIKKENKNGQQKD